MSRAVDSTLVASLAEHPDYTYLSHPSFFVDELEGILSPLYLPSIERGVALFKQSIAAQERIFILGDRDVDGVTATALLGDFLGHRLAYPAELLTLRVSSEGDDYGLTALVEEELERFDPQLVFLLDTGSAQQEAVTRLLAAGRKVVILDHHVPGEQGVDPKQSADLAFINPLLVADDSPQERKSASGALVFKFLYAFSLLSLPEARQATFFLPTADQHGYLFRLGTFLGRFASLVEVREVLPEEVLIEVVHGGESLFGCDRDSQRIDELIADPVVFAAKLLRGLLESKPRLYDFIHSIADLAAIASVADMMPLAGENRHIVRLGCGWRRSGDGKRYMRPAVRSLLRVLSIAPERITGKDLGWSIGPLLNAAGRMGRTELALKLLLERDEACAEVLAKELMQLNRRRKARTEKNYQLANDRLAPILEKGPQPLLFCYDEKLESGVSGIVATRLAQQHSCPVVCIHPDGEYARGSIRSTGTSSFASANGAKVVQLDLLELLGEASDLFIQYGGHREAAGFSVAYDSIEKLEKRLIEAARRQRTAAQKRIGTAATGVEEEAVQPWHLQLAPEQLSWGVRRELDLLEPFGQAHREPMIYLPQVEPDRVDYLSGGRHVKFSFARSSFSGGTRVEAVAWGKGEEFSELYQMWQAGVIESIDLYGILENSSFKGRQSLMFRIEEFGASQKQPAPAIAAEADTSN